MRRYAVSLLAFAFLLLTVGVAAAQQRSTTTTTTTTTQTTATGPEHNIEGCILKESSDFFLLPERGAPFKLQSNQNLSADEGHKVIVSGKETALNAAAGTMANPAGGTAASPTAAGSAAASSGTGNDLHSMADREMIVDNVRSVANTCPVNWNPGVRRPAR
jgi:hypothetical protein